MRRVAVYLFCFAISEAIWAQRAGQVTGRTRLQRPSRPQRSQPHPQPRVERPQTATRDAAFERLDRLSHLSAEERRQAFGGLSPEQQQQLQSGLVRLDHLSPKDREQLLNRYRRFDELSPQQQDAVRKVVGQFRELPENRRFAVKQELDGLTRMSDADRAARLKSDAFRKNYSGSERKIIEKSSAILPGNSDLLRPQ